MPHTHIEPFTILLVEDNPAHAELVKLSFAEHRVPNRIFHLLDGEEALNYLHRRGRFESATASPRPHVVLLDLRLPRIDGLEVLQNIKSDESLCDIPVVILTTSQAERDANLAYAKHANSFVVKPMDFDEFSRLMDELGHYWLGWNYFPWSERPKRT